MNIVQPTQKFTIELLKEHTNCISDIVDMWCALLGKTWEPTISREEVTSWCYNWLNEDIPLAYVAFDHDRPIGMCSLEMNDDLKLDVAPWLCDLCVLKPYQRQGVGTLLIAVAKEKAKALGFNKLYLFVLNPEVMGYYSKLGWTKIGIDCYQGHTVSVMEIDL